MRKVPDIAPESPRTFAEAEQASENLARQVGRARQALSDYHAIHPVVGPGAVDGEDSESPLTAREQAAEAADSADLHPKA